MQITETKTIYTIPEQQKHNTTVIDGLSKHLETRSFSHLFFFFGIINNDRCKLWKRLFFDNTDDSHARTCY